MHAVRKHFPLVIVFLLGLFVVFGVLLGATSVSAQPACLNLSLSAIRHVTLDRGGDGITPHVASAIITDDNYNPEAIERFYGWAYSWANGWQEWWSDDDPSTPLAPVGKQIGVVNVITRGGYDGQGDFESRFSGNWRGDIYESTRDPDERFIAFYRFNDLDGHPDCWLSIQASEMVGFLNDTYESLRPIPGFWEPRPANWLNGYAYDEQLRNHVSYYCAVVAGWHIGRPDASEIEFEQAYWRCEDAKYELQSYQEREAFLQNAIDNLTPVPAGVDQLILPGNCTGTYDPETDFVSISCLFTTD